MICERERERERERNSERRVKEKEGWKGNENKGHNPFPPFLLLSHSNFPSLSIHH
jgi:hypothetical protein